MSPPAVLAELLVLAEVILNLRVFMAVVLGLVLLLLLATIVYQHPSRPCPNCGGAVRITSRTCPHCMYQFSVFRWRR
jgi:hypothetical protein